MLRGTGFTLDFYTLIDYQCIMMIKKRKEKFQIFNTPIFYLPYTFSQEATGRQAPPVKESKPRKRKAWHRGNRKEIGRLS